MTWNRNQVRTKRRIDYPILEVLRDCRKAAGLDARRRPRSSKPRVLFVEDDTDTRELVSFVLTRENYEVQLADNAEQGALLAQSRPYDLYLIDNWMPGTNGIDLCIRLREVDAHTPILFFSGAAYEEDKRAAMAAGAQGYLTKPAGIEELLAEVSRVISAARSAAAQLRVFEVSA